MTLHELITESRELELEKEKLMVKRSKKQPYSKKRFHKISIRLEELRSEFHRNNYARSPEIEKYIFGRDKRKA